MKKVILCISVFLSSATSCGSPTIDAPDVSASPVEDGGIADTRTKIRGQWLLFNTPPASDSPVGCMCQADGTWSCMAAEEIAHWMSGLTVMCSNKPEDSECAGSVAQTSNQRGFEVPAGRCHAGACCPGCWDGSVCRVHFKYSPVSLSVDQPSIQKVMDYVSYGPGNHDWTYFCGSEGGTCIRSKGDGSLSPSCNIRASVAPFEPCPGIIQ